MTTLCHRILPQLLCFLYIIIWCGAFPAAASETPALLQAANSAYAADDYGYAIASYEEALRTDGSSPALLYNLGNAYYRSGRPGKAIVSYERALQLDPSFRDASFNLAFVRARLVDRQADRSTFFETCLNTLLSLMPSNAYAWIGALLFAAFIALAAIYMYTTPVALRKIGFFGGIAALALSIVSLVLAGIGASRMNSHDQAIVTSSSVILSTSPRPARDHNEEVALLHEGSAVKVLDSLTNTTDSTSARLWYKVELDSDHKGWAPATNLEII